MKKAILIILVSLCSLSVLAQMTKLNEKIVNVPIVGGKVVFLREVSLPENMSETAAYKTLKDWMVENYGRNPFISSVSFDSTKREMNAVSRIELILLADSHGNKEHFVMRYRLNIYVLDNRCVLEISDMTFVYKKMKGQTPLNIKKPIGATDMISDFAIDCKDELEEVRLNTRKSTLQFVNQLAKDFESTLGYTPTFW